MKELTVLMERADNFSEDSMLADALSKLEVLEKENAKLRQGGEVDNDGSLEVQQLKVQNKEVCNVFSGWTACGYNQVCLNGTECNQLVLAV